MFGDPRLDSVLSRFLLAMTPRLSVFLRNLGDTRAVEVCFGRFINNPKVTPDKIVSTLAAQSSISCTSEHILLITDTTAARFGLYANRGDLGHVGQSTQLSGFYAHPALGINAITGACLAPQVETFEALSNLAALALVAAVQVVQLVQARDGQTQQDIAAVFSKIEIECLEQLSETLEGKTQKQKNPHDKHQLAFAAWVSQG
jgi:hypothetical protein